MYSKYYICSMIEIQDVVVPTKGTGKYLNTTVLNFQIEPTNGVALYWQIFSQTTVLNPETQEEETRPGSMLLDGNLQYPQADYETWGTDDSVVTDWVMEQLNLTPVTA